MVITQEGPNQEGKTWDVELMSAQAYGEAQMKALAREMGEQGEYVVLVGTLTTTGHNQWADVHKSARRFTSSSEIVDLNLEPVFRMRSNSASRSAIHAHAAGAASCLVAYSVLKYRIGLS